MAPHLNKSFNQCQLQLPPPKVLSLVEDPISQVRWIALSLRKESHALVSMSMDAKNIGVPNVPRKDNGVTISPRDMMNG